MDDPLVFCILLSAGSGEAGGDGESREIIEEEKLSVINLY